MPWTEPREWVTNDVLSGPRINDIRNDVKYLSVASRSYHSFYGGNGSSNQNKEFMYWPEGDLTYAQAFTLPFTKYEDDTYMLVTWAVGSYDTDVESVVAFALEVEGVQWGGQMLTANPPRFQYPVHHLVDGTRDYESFGTFKLTIPRGTYEGILMVKVGTDETFETGGDIGTATSTSGGFMHAIETWDGIDS